MKKCFGTGGGDAAFAKMPVFPDVMKEEPSGRLCQGRGAIVMKTLGGAGQQRIETWRGLDGSGLQSAGKKRTGKHRPSRPFPFEAGTLMIGGTATHAGAQGSLGREICGHGPSQQQAEQSRVDHCGLNQRDGFSTLPVHILP